MTKGIARKRSSALRLCRLQCRSFRQYLVSFLARKTRAQMATYRAPEYNMPLWLTDWLWRLSFFLDQSNSTNMAEYIEYLLLVKVNRIPFSDSRGIVKMSRQIRGQGGHLAFLIGLKTTNMVEDVTILLSVKFHQIELCGFREKVEHVSVN